MSKRGKRYRAAAAVVEARPYELPEALEVLRKMPRAGFDETVELALRLGVDPRHADQMVRGTVVLPHGTGKTMRVVVFAQGEKVKEAEAAGADTVGGEDLAAKIQGGWLEFDVAIATPDMMRHVGKLGKILGPRGLMPNPKVGTVTFEVERAVKEAKGGRVEFRVDKAGNLQGPVGRISFEEKALVENIRAFIDAVVRAKPSGAKGRYLLNGVLSTTMSPGVTLDLSEF